jgi:endonuclease III
VEEVADALTREYKDFDHNNLKDPLDELLFIICSQKTDVRTYSTVFADLRSAFPTNDELFAAGEAELELVLRRGGLSRRKSKAIFQLLRAIQTQTGAQTLDNLEELSTADAERFLLSLPGVGEKVARCVLLYSLGREVFPVDVHCWRICRRLGWVRRKRNDERCRPSDMNRVEQRIPEHLRFSLHVNMVSHGRAVCTPRNPRCDQCVLSQYCKRIRV